MEFGDTQGTRTGGDQGNKLCPGVIKNRSAEAILPRQPGQNGKEKKKDN